MKKGLQWAVSAMFLLFFCTASSNVEAQVLTYSESFTQSQGYCTGDSQWDNWKQFINDLDPNAGYTRIRFYGSRDPVGVDLTDPAKIIQIVTALKDHESGFVPQVTVSDNGNLWRVGRCGNGAELRVDPFNPFICQCASNTFTIRPTISCYNRNWGGISGATCNADSQTLTIEVFGADATVPTMSQWGLFLFGMVVMTLGVVFLYNSRRALA